MDVEHNACMLGRAGWPARLRGALVHTHTEHNHTCGELELSFTVLGWALFGM
jgi:hypothetical protein